MARWAEDPTSCTHGVSRMFKQRTGFDPAGKAGRLTYVGKPSRLASMSGGLFLRGLEVLDHHG